MDDSLLFGIIFTVWYILAIVVAEKVGKKRKIGEEWSFFLSFMLSPLIGYFVSVMTKRQ